MQHSRLKEEEIALPFNRPGYLNLCCAGKNIQEISREHAVSKATIYNWKAKYGGMEMNELKRVKELEEENRKLKQMYADLALDNRMLRDVLGKKF